MKPTKTQRISHQPKPLRQRLEVFVYSTPVEILVYVLIILSVTMIAVEVSDPAFVIKYKHLFDVAEVGFIIFFVVEYVVKFAVAKNKWLFFRRYFIDLLAILPFLRFFRLFRGFRILRLLRVVRLLRLGNMITRRLSKIDGAKNLREASIVTIVFLSSVLAGSIGILMFERGHPDGHFKNLGDGLWWSLVTLTTVGYGDKFPQTGEGKVLGGVIMLVGLSFYGLVAGLGSNFIISRLKRGSEWMVSTFEDHTVILGVNDKLKRVDNLLLEMNQRVVIVTQDVDRVPQYPEHLVAMIEGDFVEVSILERARVREAKTAIILADTHQRRMRDADARSVLAALAVEKMNPDINTVVEALSEDTTFHLENADVDDILQSGAITAEMLAFSSDHPGYAEHLQVLLRFVHQNRVVTFETPQRLVGKTLYDTQTLLAGEQRILLAVTRDGEETLDPDLVLNADDTLTCVEIL